MANWLASLAINLTANVAGFISDFGRAEREAGRSMRKMQSDAEKFGKAAGLAFAGAATAATLMVKKALDGAENIAKMSAKFGVSTEALSGLRVAAELSDTSIQQLETGFSKLTKQMAEAAKGSQQQVQLFDALGIKVTDASGKLRSSEAVFGELVKTFGALPDGANKTALSLEVFGRSGAQLLPMLKELQGMGGLDGAIDKADELGLKLSKEAAAGAEAFNDSITEAKLGVEGMALQVGIKLLPTLNDITKTLNSKEFRDGFGTLVQGAADAAIAFSKLTIEVGKFFKGLGEGLAREVSGPELGDINGILKEIQQQERLLAQLNQAGTASVRQNQSAYAKEQEAELKRLYEQLRLAQEMQKNVTVAKEEDTKVTKENSSAIGETNDRLTEFFARMKADAEATKNASAQRREYTEAMRDWSQMQKQHDAEMLKAEQIERDLARVRDEAIADIEEMRRVLELETRFAGLSREEARKLENAERALGLAREFANAAAKDGLGDVEARTEAFRKEAEAAFNNADAQREMVANAERTADEFRGIWENAANGVGDALTSALFDGAKSGADAIKDVMENLARDLVRFWLQQKIVIPLQQQMMGGQQGGGIMGMFGNLFGGGGAAGGAAGGGGFMGWLGGLFGGGAGGASGAAGAGAGGAGGGLMSGIGAIPVAGWIAMAIMLNQSLFKGGWSARPGGLTLPNGQNVTGGGLQTNPSMILGGTGAFASNALNRVFGSLGLSDSTSSLLSGSAVMNRLFGRKAPRLTSGTATYDFSGSAIGGSQQFGTVEEGGFFRSDRRRTHNSALTGDALSAGEELYAMFSDIMKDVADRLKDDAPAAFNAAFRIVEEFDKKGEVKSTKFLVDVLGRTWEEATQELAMTRLNAEAIIQGIDDAFGSVSGDIGEAIGENVGNTVIDAMDRVGDMVGNKSKALESIGQASEIAERWRDDAEALLEGANFLLAAATDIRHGVGLLGEDGGLTEITDLIEEMQKGTETLSDTYVRAVQQTNLMDDAMRTFAAAFEGTREQFVLFSDEVASAAGGIQRLTSLFDSALNTLFSPGERAQMAVSAATAARDREFGDVGWSSGMSTEQMRAEVLEALNSGNAALIAEVLEAVAAFGTLQEALAVLAGTFTDATSAFTVFGQEAGRVLNDWGNGGITMEDVANRLEAADDFIEGAQFDEYLAGLSEYEQQVASIHQTYQDQIEAIEGLKGSEQRIAELRRLEREEIDRLADSVQNMTVAFADAGMIALQLQNDQREALDEMTKARQGIRQWLDAQNFSENSSLNPQQMLEEARRQFNVGLLGAQAGDLDSLRGITGQADQFLAQARNFYGASDDFTRIERQVRGALEGLATAPNDPLLLTTQDILEELRELNRGLNAGIVTRADLALRDNPTVGDGRYVRLPTEAPTYDLAKNMEKVGDRLVRATKENDDRWLRALEQLGRGKNRATV